METISRIKKFTSINQSTLQISPPHWRELKEYFQYNKATELVLLSS